VRTLAALLLPLIVPAVITMILWALPGDPVEIVCPPQLCTGGAHLAAMRRLDHGPWYFYEWWVWDAFHLDFGTSWRVVQGFPVSGLMAEAIPATTFLVLLAMVPVLVGSAFAATGWATKRIDPLLQGIGLIPAVILALVFAAWVTITYGALSLDGWPGTLRVILGALTLGITDSALSGAVIGTRSVFEAEIKQRYIGIAILRGETVLSNALPNVLPALVGQLRGRLLHLMSGAVVVEVVLGISGLGSLLWEGTLKQDFGVVLAAAWAFAMLSSVLLLIQAGVEVGTAMYIRRAPAVAA
jgi:peptide/nickel transport system permease protein